MKQNSTIRFLLALTVSAILACCTSPRELVFANREWHISDYYGQIIDKDTTYRMTFGNILIPKALAIVSSTDSVAKYPGMDKFLSDILKTVRIDSAEILFYAPEMATMFVRPTGKMPPMKPSSMSVALNEERPPYTMWIYDDMDEWIRKPNEMYTYIYFNKRKKQLLILDTYDYGDTPIAQISIYQSQNKRTEDMNIPQYLYNGFYRWHDLKNGFRDIEFWAHCIENRRKNAFANYKIGQEQRKK